MVTKLPNQTILDVALRHGGTVECLFDLMKLNNIEQLKLPPIIELSTPAVQRTPVVNYYQNNLIDIATRDETEPYKSFNKSFNKSFH